MKLDSNQIKFLKMILTVILDAEEMTVLAVSRNSMEHGTISYLLLM